MSQGLLDKYGLGVTGTFSDRLGRGQDETAASEIEDHACYSVLRGNRDRAVHLQLIKKDGRIFAPAYSYVSRIEYDPAGKIVLHAAGHVVLISGRNLNQSHGQSRGLLDALTRHRVQWIREVDEAVSLEAADDNVLVDGISWDTDGAA